MKQKMKCDCVKSICPQLEQGIYLGAVVPDGFVLLLTILLSVGEIGEDMQEKKKVKKN